MVDLEQPVNILLKFKRQYLSISGGIANEWNEANDAIKYINEINLKYKKPNMHSA